MALTLVLGPANSGKVRLLLDRFLEAVEGGQGPFLIVPTLPDVSLYERELLSRAPALLGGTVGTFGDLFATVLERCGEQARDLSALQRRRVLEQVVREADLTELGAAAHFAGFVDGLARVLDDLAASAEPGEVDRRLAAEAGEGRRAEIAALRRAYLARLDELGRRDRAGSHARAAELLAGRLDAWDGSPVLAHGFEDVSGVQLAALRALAAVCPVTVSLPYETGREAYAAVRPVVDVLSALPHDLIELPPGHHVESERLAHLERFLFSDREPDPAPADDGSLVLLEACGLRGVADQVAAEALALVRGGTAPEQIAVLVPDVAPWRLPVESAFAACSLPVELDARVDLPATAFGQALVGLLRFAWFDGDRSTLFRFLRSPFSGVGRRSVDWGEGRLRGRGVVEGGETRETLLEMDYARLVFAAQRLAESEDPLEAVAELVGRMSAAAGGLGARVHDAPLRRHLAAVRAVLRALEELRELTVLGMAAPDRAGLLDLLQRVPVRLGSGTAPGRVALLDLRRARTRRFQAVFVLGLEEGSLPRGARDNAFLTVEEAEQLGVTRLDPAQRDRHLFAVAVTRPWQRLFLCRQAATEDGVLRERSPFLDEVERVLAPHPPAHRRRALGDLTWGLDEAPTDRERLRALARELRERESWAISSAHARDGWARKLERASGAYLRRTELRHPLVLAALAEQGRFSVTELEKFADCSSAWFVERFLSPGEIDYEFGAKERGSVAHTALHHFYERLPRELAVERLDESNLVRAYPLMRECLADALRSARVPGTPAGKQTVRGLERDLEGYLRAEVALASPMVPSQFEVRFGTVSSAPGLKDGLKLEGFAVSGTIDRIDKDPLLSARGIVWDYKSGREVHSAAQIESKVRLQIPLYILAARELLGVEPVAGLYRALAGVRGARGMAVDGEIERLAANDQLDEAEFWARVQRAVERANEIVGRIRAGDVKHDPADGTCPEWCVRRVGGICRVERR